VVGLVVDHVVAVELFGGVAYPYPELGRPMPALVRFGEDRFPRGCDSDHTNIESVEFLESNTDNPCSLNGEVVVQMLPEVSS